MNCLTLLTGKRLVLFRVLIFRIAAAVGTRYNTRQECIPQYRTVSKTKGILPGKYAYTGRSEEHHASGTGVSEAEKSNIQGGQIG